MREKICSWPADAAYHKALPGHSRREYHYFNSKERVFQHQEGGKDCADAGELCRENHIPFCAALWYTIPKGAMRMWEVLLLEDDAALGRGVRLALQSEKLHVTRCGTLVQAREAWGRGAFDLLILDVNLPDGSGLGWLRELRRGTPAPSACYEAEGLSLDFERMEFRRDGQIVELSKTEQKLLRVLVENRGRTVPRETLLDRVWTDGAEYVEENALSVTVKRLRDKLEEMPSKPRLLKTVYGIGYTWVAK